MCLISKFPSPDKSENPPSPFRNFRDGDGDCSG